MAEQAEGSIIIGTELNSDGFKAGSKELLAAITALSEEVKNLGATLKGIFEKPLTPEVNTSSAEDQVAALEAQVRELEAAMEEMRNAGSPGQTAAPEVNMGGTTQKASDLQRQIDSVNSSVERLEPTFQKAMSGSESSMTSFEGRASALENKIAELQQRLETVGQTKFPTQEYAAVGAELSKLEGQLARVDARKRRFIETGVNPDSSTFRRMEYDADQITAAYDRALAKKQELENSGGAYVAGADTAHYAQMGAALAEAKSQLEEMQARLAEVQEGAGQSEERMSGLSSFARSAATHIGKAAKSATGGLVKGIKSAASHMGRMLFHSKKMNGQFSGLISSAKKFTLSLLGARGVYALLRKAVSAYMAENQQLSNTLSACWSGIGNLLGPIITKLINLVAQAVAYVTSFLKLLGIIGASTTKAISGADGAASNAVKDLKRQLASFDELNILSSNSSDSGGGGSAGDIGAELPDVTLPDWAKLMAEQIKTGKWSDAGTSLGIALNELIDGVDWVAWGKKLGTGIQNGLSFALGFIRTTNWENLGAGIATFLNNAISNINPKDLGALLASKLRIAIGTAYGFVTTFDWRGFGVWLSRIVVGWFAEIDWIEAAKALSIGIKGALTSAAVFLKKTDWKDIGAKIGSFLKNIEWGDMLNGLWETLKAAGQALLDFLDGLLDGLGGILPVVKAIGIAFATWKITSGVAGALDRIFGLFGKKTGGIGSGLQIPSPKTVLKGLADLTLIIGGTMALLTVINEVSKTSGFEETISGGLAALKTVFVGLGEIGIQVAAVGAITAALGKIGVKTIAGGMADLAVILAGVPAVIVAVGALMSVSGFQDFLGTGVESIKTAFRGICDVALEIGIFSAVIAGLGFASPATIGAGLLGFAEIIGGLELILVALGGLNQIPGFSWIVGEGGKALMQLGEILGGFAGSIVSGLLTTISDSFPAIADNLSLFAQKLEPFLTAMEKVDGGVASAAKNLAEAILAFSGASLIDAVTSWISGGKSLVDFGEQLAQFGPKFAEYADSVSGIDPSVVEASANAASAMVSLAKEIPGQGGVLQWLLGSQDIGAFGAQLKTFGECFKDYSDTVKDIDPSVVEASANAAQAMIKLAKEIPSQDGVLQWLIGGQDIGAFGQQLQTFGECFVAYSKSAENISPAVVSASVNAAQALVALAQDIPTSGGFVSWLLGDNDMGTFGENLETFGQSFKRYYDSIASMNLTVVNTANTTLRNLLEAAERMEGIDTDAVEDFGEAVEDLGENLSETNWSGVSGDFTSGMSDMLSSLNSTISGMKTGMTGLESNLLTVWGRIVTNVSTKWEKTRTEIEKNNDSVNQDTTRKWSSLEKTMNTHCTNIRKKVSDSFAEARKNAISRTSELVRSVSNSWNGLVRTLNTHGTNIQKKVSSSFTEAKKNVTSRVSEMVGSVSNSLGGLAKKAYTWGKDICLNLANGINNAADNVTNAATGVANEIKAVLGFSEPEKGPLSDFHTYMPDMIDLMTKGVRDNQGRAISAVSDMASAISEEVQNGDYALAGGIPAAEVDGILNSFSDKITDGFSSMLDRLQAIAEGVTFKVPAVASSAVPYKTLTAAANSSSGDVGNAIETSNDALAGVITQVVMNATNAIVAAIQNYSGTTVNLDKNSIAENVIKEINRRTRMAGKSPLVG